MFDNLPVTVSLTMGQFQAILNVLSQRPLGDMWTLVPAIDAMRNQMQEQVNAAQIKAAMPPPEAPVAPEAPPAAPE